jgi:hypothetical protein
MATADKKVARPAGDKVLSVDERAAALLLEAGGVLAKGAAVSVEAEEQFGEKFVGLMEDDLIVDMRAMFGLSRDGARVDLLEALAADAED